MSNILKAFLDSDNPVIMIAGSKSPVNVFQGEFEGAKYAFGMNAEEAFDPFVKGKKLNKIALPSEIASESLPKQLDSMVLSDGTKIAVTNDMSLNMSNEELNSPVTGETVTVAYDPEGESEMVSEELEMEDEVQEDEAGPETVEEDDTSTIEDDVSEEDISEPETEDESMEDESEMEDESVDESEMEDETPIDMDVEAASFVTNKNLRFVAFDSSASEVAMFAGDIHVATFSQKEAHESKRGLFVKPAFSSHIQALAEKASFDFNHTDFKPYGIKPVKFTVNVPSLTTRLVKEITNEVASMKSEEASDNNAKTKETLKLALVGMSKGVINSPIVSEIASVFETLGVKNAQSLVAKALHNNAEGFAKAIFEEASVLATKNEDYLKGFAEVCAKATFVASNIKSSEVANYVPSTNFHIPVAPFKEAGIKTRPRISVTI